MYKHRYLIFTVQFLDYYYRMELMGKLLIKVLFQQVRVCNLEAERDGEDKGERYIANLWPIQQAWSYQLREDNITESLGGTVMTWDYWDMGEKSRAMHLYMCVFLANCNGSTIYIGGNVKKTRREGGFLLCFFILRGRIRRCELCAEREKTLYFVQDFTQYP